MATLLEWVKDLGPTIVGLAVIYASHRHTGRVLKQTVASTDAANQHAAELNKATLDHALELNKRNNDLTLELDERRARREALRWRIEQGVASLGKAQMLAQVASNVRSAVDVEAAHNDVRERVYELRPLLRLVFGEKDVDPLVFAITESARTRAAGATGVSFDVAIPILNGVENMNRALEKLQAELEGKAPAPPPPEPPSPKG